MNLNDIYTLEDRGLVFINGVDAKKFLQNIVSNDVEKITDKSTIFSSLLTPQGKYLFDFIEFILSKFIIADFNDRGFEL